MNKTKSTFAVLALMMLAFAGPAAAQHDRGMYLGGSVGYSLYKDTCKHLLIPCEDNDTGWRAFGGYQFHRYWAAEIAYANLGTLTGSTPDFGGAPGSFSRETTGLDLTAVGSIPLATRLSAIVRAGVYRMRTTQDQEGFFGTIHQAGTNTGWTYGAGLNLQFGPIGLRGEWQAYENVGVHSTQEDDINVFSLGLIWRF